MNLTYANGIYVFDTDYYGRHVPKEAGFLWHTEKCHRANCLACENGIGKAWWTSRASVAANLLEYADEDTRGTLQELAKEKQERIELSNAADAAVELACPEGLEYLPFQRAGILYALDAFDRERGCLIADEMGLGKTIQAIGAVNQLPDVRNILVICPASVKLNWRKELVTWLVRPLDIAVATSKIWPAYADVIIINYDILGRYAEELRAGVWDMIILDEAHYAKNQQAQRSRQIYGGTFKVKGDKVHVGPIPARRRLLLTGTPIENRPKEIYPLASYCDPSLWKNEWEFLNTYYIQETEYVPRRGYKGRQPVKKFEQTRNLEQLNEKLRASIMVRRKTEDVLAELPEKRRQIIELPANGAKRTIQREFEAYRAYEEAARNVENARQYADETDYRERFRKLRSVMLEAKNNLAQLRKETGLLKVPVALAHLTDILDSVQKVVVFAYHREVIEQIEEHFGPMAVKLYGGMSERAKQDSIDRFQNDPTCRVFVGSILAAGVGITLTAAHHMVFVEEDWVPGRIEQAEKRCHRIGQENTVLIQHLPFEGSIDIEMANRNLDKAEVIEKALDFEFMED